jgi:hypothetical protein
MDRYVDEFGEMFKRLAELEAWSKRDNPDEAARMRAAEARAAQFNMITARQHEKLREQFKPFLKLGML